MINLKKTNVRKYFSHLLNTIKAKKKKLKANEDEYKSLRELHEEHVNSVRHYSYNKGRHLHVFVHGLAGMIIHTIEIHYL